MKNFNDENLKDFFIFDFYKNEKLKEIKVGLDLFFSHTIKLFLIEDIQKSIDNILKTNYQFRWSFYTWTRIKVALHDYS